MSKSRREQFWFLTVVLVVAAAAGSGECLAQAGETRQVQAREAAKMFYREYLPRFGFPMEADLSALRPYLSPRLHSLLGYELRRMTAWSTQNPDLKPPVMADLFTCNGYERPQRFRVGKVYGAGPRVSVDVRFDLIERNKVVDRCRVRASFIQQNGKWLLDNVFLDGEVDLRRLLSRKDYTVLPQLHPRSDR